MCALPLTGSALTTVRAVVSAVSATMCAVVSTVRALPAVGTVMSTVDAPHAAGGA